MTATRLRTWGPVLRKLAHAAEFGLLAILVQRATRSVWVALLAASTYALTDEVHQAFVRGRHASPIDWAIDTVGAALGLFLFALWRRRR